MLSKIFERLGKFFERFKVFFEKNFTNLALLLIYFLGIGPTAILAKLFKKKFLSSQKDQNSNFHQHLHPDNFKQAEKMY